MKLGKVKRSHSLIFTNLRPKTNGKYTGHYLTIIKGLGIGCTRIILDSKKGVLETEGFSENPDRSSEFRIS